MNVPPILSTTPPILGSEVRIVYELTRWDLFLNSMTVVLRNRLLQIIILVALILNGALILVPQIGKATPIELLFSVVFLVITFAFMILLFQGIMGIATAYALKQNGVVGEHTLIVTDAGMIERTAFNETLHKWPSILRITPLLGYIYIYVGDHNSHQIPRRCLDPLALESFLSTLRAHCPHLGR